MKKILQNRTYAWIITGIIIIASFLAGGAKSLNRVAAEAEGIFYDGGSGDGMGVQRELDHRATYTHNMITVANRYIRDDKTVAEAETARAALTGADGIKHKHECDRMLTGAVYDLYERLGEIELSETDASFRENLFMEFKARASRMSNDPYNKLAREYNQLLRAFPANVIRSLGLVSDLPVF